MSNNNINNETFTIYTGPWINWQQGALFGAQATLSARDSQILSSFLSIFVGIVGVQLWQLISYIVHQLRSIDRPSDGLHQQIQIVFRNATSPWSAAKEFLDLLWSWRRRADRYFSRSIPWAILALAYAAGFGVLSIFAASEISKAPGNLRLIKGQNCGFYSDDNLDVASNQAWQQGQVVDAAAAAQYAASCYPGNTSTTFVAQCDVFAKPFINFTQVHTNVCPFDGICNMTHASPLVMDTGMLDSAVVFGINTPKNERIQYRKVATCSPLDETNLVTHINITDPDNSIFPSQKGDTIITYNYGPQGDLYNFTFFHNTHAANDQIGYSLETDFSYAHASTDPNEGWVPIPALNRTDADVMFVAIAMNSMQFEATNNDPIFTAHSPAIDPNGVGNPLNFYFADHFVGTIACTEQFQLCNPNNNRCTSLSGHFDAGNEMFHLGINNMQSMVANRLGTAISRSGLYTAVDGRGASALQAQNSVSQLFQAPLPDNQWEVEAAGWFSADMARHQQEVQQFATRSSSVNVTIPTSADGVAQKMANLNCKNQLTNESKGTVSYSLLGLGLIICLGVVIILLSYIVEPITSVLQKWVFKRGVHKQRDWVLNAQLQLHRMALESRGVGPWYDTSKKIPVTDSKVLFTGWQASDVEDGAFVPGNASQMHHNENEVADSPEDKPFISHNSEPAYKGHNRPVLHVQEYE